MKRYNPLKDVHWYLNTVILTLGVCISLIWVEDGIKVDSNFAIALGIASSIIITTIVSGRYYLFVKKYYEVN